MKRQKRDTTHRAYIKGYQVGFSGRANDNCPYSGENPLCAEWIKGWREGREDHWQGYSASTGQQKVVSM